MLPSLLAGCDSSCFTCFDGTADWLLSVLAGEYLDSRTHQCVPDKPLHTWCNESSFCFDCDSSLFQLLRQQRDVAVFHAMRRSDTNSWMLLHIVA